MTDTFYWDRSQWNGIITAAAFGQVEALRIDTGFQTDPLWGQNFANAQAAHASGKLEFLIAYVVHKTGQESAVTARVKAAVGDCPEWLGFMVDEESGAQFDGPGDHAAGANLQVEQLAAFTGRGIAAVCGYANSPDWASNWASRVAGLKRIVADYSDTPPAAGWYGWQYWGGVPNPAPHGYPTPTALDMNVIPRTIEQILEDFGVPMAAVDLTPTAVGQVAVAVAKLIIGLPEQQHEYNISIQDQTILNSIRTTLGSIASSQAAIESAEAAIQAAVAKLNPAS